MMKRGGINDGKSVSSSTSSAAAVTVALSSHPLSTPLGMLLAPASAPNSSSAPSTSPFATPVSTSKTATPKDSTWTIVVGWERLPRTNRMGPIQLDGRVRLGDRLIAVNGVDVTGMSFRDLMRLLRGMLHLGGNKTENDEGRINTSAPRLRTLGFTPLSRVVGDGRTNDKIIRDGAKGQLLRRQTPFEFTSHISRARICIPNSDDNSVEETIIVDTNTPSAMWPTTAKDGSDLPSEPLAISDHNTDGEEHRRNERQWKHEKSAFIEYEISCRLISRYPGGALTNRNASYDGEEKTWAVWKRYSALKMLDEKLRKTYGWQMCSLNGGRGLPFPPGRLLSSLFFGKSDPMFIRWRQQDLNRYWQSLRQIGEIFDFANSPTNRYSLDMAEFLEVDRQRREFADSVRPLDTDRRHMSSADSLDAMSLPTNNSRRGKGRRHRRHRHFDDSLEETQSLPALMNRPQRRNSQKSLFLEQLSESSTTNHDLPEKIGLKHNHDIPTMIEGGVSLTPAKGKRRKGAARKAHSAFQRQSQNQDW